MTAKKLTDPDFIKWAERPTWAAREAIAVLYGYRPQQKLAEQINAASAAEAFQRQFNELMLDTRFPLQEDDWEPSEEVLDARDRPQEILLHYLEYDNLAERFRSPPHWVQRASFNGLKIAREWEVIFPYSLKMRLGVSLQQEPDYRDFVDSLTRNMELLAKDFVCYALNVHPDRFNQSSESRELLAHLYSEMRRESDFSDIDELRNTKLAVSWFQDHCQASKHSLDAGFLDWVSWFKKHPKLRSHLSGDELPLSGRSRAPKYDRILQAAINEIFPTLARQSPTGFIDHLRQKGADAAKLGFMGLEIAVEGCDEMYVDGDKLIWVDRNNIDREQSLQLVSIDPYLKRAKEELE